jgi:tRNA-splicing ligase RtcB
MGTSSYIIKGLGNEESFQSCAHGAGRRLGRKEAKRTISEKEADKAISGVLLGHWYGRFDEAPQAYKNIDEVMKQQQDLVKIITKLQPLAVIIGD